MRATEEAYKRAALHRDFAAAGVKSGLRPPVDLTRAGAEVAQLEVRRIQAASGEARYLTNSSYLSSSQRLSHRILATRRGRVNPCGSSDSKISTRSP